MTNTERNTFRNAFEARLAEIGDGGANREALAIDTCPGEMDRIQYASNRDYAVSSLERDASRLRELRAALAASTPVLSASASAASSHQPQAPGGNPVGVVLHRLPGSRGPQPEIAGE